MEQQLIQIFATILDKPARQISRDTDFFEAAGDSLDFAELLIALEASCPVEIEADYVLGLASGQRIPSRIARMIVAKQKPLKAK
jgi:acyl carrier protein